MKELFLENLRSSIENLIKEERTDITLDDLNDYLRKIDEDEKTIRSVKISKPKIIDRDIIFHFIYLKNENENNRKEVVFYLEKNDDYFYFSNNINEKILVIDKYVFEKILWSSKLEYFKEIIQQINIMLDNEIINLKKFLTNKQEKLLQKNFEDTMKELFLKDDLEKVIQSTQKEKSKFKI